MKRLTILLLVLVLCIASVTASAEGFDVSMFEGVENFAVNVHEANDFVSIDVEDAEPCAFYISDSKSILGGLLPSFKYTTDDELTFALFCRVISQDYVNFDQIIIKVGENRYTFSNIDSLLGESGRSTISVESGTYVLESTAIIIDAQNVAFLDDLKAHATEEIKVRLKGDYDCDFTMSETLVQTILTAYDLFVEAGGMDYLTDADGTPITVR